MKYDIIIPVWNQSDLTVKCLQSIKKKTKHYKIILIDNGSEKSEFDVIFKELQNHEHLLIRNCQNLGFVKAVNQGLAASQSQYVIIQNNDTEVITNGWADKLQNCFQLHKVGISAPITNNVNQWQGREVLCDKVRIIDKGKMVAFFSVMISKECINKVGYLDECFGVGFGDDDDYCLRTQKAGFNIVLNNGVMVNHWHRSTFKKIYSLDEISDMQKEALKKYKKKHELD
jgi:GT2 family glycosyltransferase